MTPFRSLCLETDRAATTGLTEWTETADYAVMRTPSEPTYWFGNGLIFRHGRVVPEVQVALFRREFPDAPHIVLQWDEPDLDIGPHVDALTALGLQTDKAEVLTRQGPPLEAPLADGMVVRKIESDDDWAQVTELQGVTGLVEGQDPEPHLAYIRQRYANVRQQMESGLGARFGIFDGALLVADMGVILMEHLVRYQNVATRDSHRRKGLCAALLAHTGRWADAQRPGARQVIVADLDSAAGRIYKRAGFAFAETLMSAFKPSY